MKKEAPKLRVIKGGKKDPKVKLGMGLFLVLAICSMYLLIVLWSMYGN